MTFTYGYVIYGTMTDGKQIICGSIYGETHVTPGDSIGSKMNSLTEYPMQQLTSLGFKNLISVCLFFNQIGG
jgi:hypothetical protein